VRAPRDDEAQAPEVVLVHPRVDRERVEERRGHRDVGHAVGGDELEQGLEDRAGEGDDARPDAQRRGEHEHEADRVEERRAGEDDRSLVEGAGGAEGGRALCRTRGEVAVRDAHALGQAAGAAGERHGGERVGPEVGLGVRVCGVAGQERLDRRRARRLAAEDREIDVVQARGGERRAHHWPERGEGDRRPGHRAREHARRLVGRPQGAQRGDRRARAPHPQRHHRPPRQVGHRHRDEVAGAYATGAQAGGEGRRPRGQLAAGERLARRSIDHGDGARIGGGMAQEGGGHRGLACRRRQWAAMNGRGDGVHATVPPDISEHRFVLCNVTAFRYAVN
jgi:hypothetical protein